MKKLLLLLCLFFPCLLFAQIEPANYKNAVIEFKNFYNKNYADSIFNRFNTKMKAALPLDKTRLTIDQLKSQLGDIENTEFKSYNTSIAIYKTTFANGVFALKLALDAENKITGLLVQPYQEEKTLTVNANLTETPVSLK